MSGEVYYCQTLAEFQTKGHEAVSKMKERSLLDTQSGLTKPLTMTQDGLPDSGAPVLNPISIGSKPMLSEPLQEVPAANVTVGNVIPPQGGTAVVKPKRRLVTLGTKWGAMAEIEAIMQGVDAKDRPFIAGWFADEFAPKPEADKCV